MLSPKPFNIFQVLSRNINTMSNKTDYLSWKAAAHAIAHSKADTIAFQETNITWNKIHCRRIQQILQSPTGNATISTSSSTEISTSPHQQGGTLQAILGDWTSHTVQNWTRYQWSWMLDLYQIARQRQPQIHHTFSLLIL